MDTISKARRSDNMRRITSESTTPELLVRRLVHAMGYRYRLHVKNLPGKPDLVFPARRKIIEVRGCFWHQHRHCIDGKMPKSRSEYWIPKLTRNKLRDRQNLRKLRRYGWDVLLIWECEVREQADVSARIRRFLEH
ncbi:T/G mismatch-specific endonuclease [Candidatus Koribacter versatilis Ellin345]|uniref:Very short patch repair endonuclease n=1 Tax=Koribacter versatilis (strain Ellin345) TaxID=204669 RepID=Q1ISL9_KORVE|nr:DNA mismatch endonuclease Vsr [Candidatus Koribacter versatilis]ABF40131.1 T/G mismatch-specific endonuclease [Candidatus Koribacter versatilis Ellin345]